MNAFFKKSLAIAICLLTALRGAAVLADDPEVPYSPVGRVFESVHAPYMTEGGLPSQTDFFTDADFGEYRLTLLNIWDSGCANCRLELPYFQQAYEQYHRYGLNVVGVAAHYIGGTFDSAYELTQEMGLEYPQVIMDEGIGTIAYDLFFIPQTYVVDSSGTIVGFFGGFAEYSEIEQIMIDCMSLRGDVDLDGQTTLADASALAAYLMNNSPKGEPNALALANSDFNGDGRITSADLTLLADYIVNATIK